jgi:hypothetical protein
MAPVQDWQFLNPQVTSTGHRQHGHGDYFRVADDPGLKPLSPSQDSGSSRFPMVKCSYGEGPAHRTLRRNAGNHERP